MTRRELLSALGALSMLGPGCDMGPVIAIPPSSGVLSERELVTKILAAVTPTEAISLAASQLAAGLSSHTLLRATLLAGAIGIRPATGGGYHAVLQTRALRRFAERLPEPLAAGARLLSVYLVKRAHGNSPHTPPALIPPAAGEDPWAALDAAAQDWDAAAFAGSVVTLLEQQGQSAARDALYRYAGRRVYYLAHDPIAAGNLLESLDALGWDDMEDVVSAVAQVLVNQEIFSSDLPMRPESIDLWADVWERVSHVDEGWTTGDLDSDARDHLQQTLAHGSPTDGVDAFQQALADGVAPQSLWEAAFLDAVEMLLDEAGRGIGAHALTSLRALHQGYLTVSDADTRLHLTLLAGAWTPMLREELTIRSSSEQTFTSSLALLSPMEGTLEEAFAQEGGAFGGRGDSIQAARIVLGWLEAGGDPRTYEGLLLQYCLERADEEHYFKMPIACLDLADLLSDDIAPRLMACAIIACPGSSPGLSRAWEDIEALLEELNVTR